MIAIHPCAEVMCHDDDGPRGKKSCGKSWLSPSRKWYSNNVSRQSLAATYQARNWSADIKKLNVERKMDSSPISKDVHCYPRFGMHRHQESTVWEIGMDAQKKQYDTSSSIRHWLRPAVTRTPCLWFVPIAGRRGRSRLPKKNWVRASVTVLDTRLSHGAHFPRRHRAKLQ